MLTGQTSTGKSPLPGSRWLMEPTTWSEPLYQWTGSFLLKPNVQGEMFNVLLLIPPNDWATIYIAAH